MNAQIFSIGTEILLGNIVDTNSQFIAQKLVEYGIDLFKMETIGDNADIFAIQIVSYKIRCGT